MKERLSGRDRVPVDALSQHFDEARAAVLLVDDDAAMRHLLRQTLEDEGFDVYEASDGEQALHMVRSVGGGTGFDVVVSDVRMPRTTGLELVESVRQTDWLTEFVLISGFADDQVREHAEQWGAHAVLAKPFSLQRFIDAVREAARIS